MKIKAILLSTLLCALALSAAAQNFATVTSTSIYNGNNQLLPAGTILWQAVNAGGKPISYQVGGGGQQITFPTVCTVVNGAFTCQVANTSLTNPINVCFLVTVKNSSGQVVLGGNTSSGYQCVQPAMSNSWCSTTSNVTTCNFDDYVPNTAGVPTARIAPPTANTLGGVYAGDCAVGQVVIGVATTGHTDCGPGGSGGSSVWGAIGGLLSNQADLVSALALLAPINSPSFTGSPTAPTQAVSDNSTKLANTAYVQAQINSQAPGLAPVQTVAGRGGNVILAESDVTNLVTDLALKAPLSSPHLTNQPTAPTPLVGDNSTNLATTAWVNLQGYSTGAGNVTGPVSSTVNDVAVFNSTNGHNISDSGLPYQSIVAGPASSTNNDIPIYSGTTGKLIADSGINFPIPRTSLGSFIAGANGLATSAVVNTTNAANITSGLLGVAEGGMGANMTPASDGQLPISVTGKYVPTTITGDVAISSTGVSNVNFLHLAAGSSAAPSLSFNNIPGTGLYAAVAANSFAISTAVRVSGVTTLTMVTAPPNFTVGQAAHIAGVGTSSFNGDYAITTITGGGATLTYAQGGLPDASSSGGTLAAWGVAAAGYQLLFNRLQSSSSNAAIRGSIRFGPTDPILYGCPACANSVETGFGTTDQNLIHGNGSSGPIHLGDYQGVQLFGPLVTTLTGATQCAQINSTGTIGGTGAPCPTASGGTVTNTAGPLTVNQPVVGAGGVNEATLSTTFGSLSTTCTGTQNWAVSNAWLANSSITLTGACTLTVTNLLPGGNYVLKVIQDATGSRTLTLGSGCIWLVANGGHGTVTPTSTANAMDLLAFVYDGVNCLANFSRNLN